MKPGLRGLSRALVVFYVLGFVSLFADMVYEGGRSVSGAYLEHLGAPPTGAAAVGAGEFVGYVLRFLAGYFATIYQSPRLLWGLVIAGYALTATSIPLLSCAPAWEAVVSLYVLDRVGKGLRAPSRETIVAEVSRGIGLGKGFGIHELLDQVGAFAGPLLVATLIALQGYKSAFAYLAIPGAISVALVSLAFKLYSPLRGISRVAGYGAGFKGLGSKFWLYVSASSALALGFVHWAIVGYYLKSQGLLSDYEIGAAFSVAMLVDALVAIPMGHVFDKVGLRVLLVQPFLSVALVSALLFAPRALTWLIAVCYGVVMCSEESIMKASIACLVEPPKRPLAYGVFGLFFGLAWAIGGFIYSHALASWSKPHVLVYATAASATSAYLYAKLSTGALLASNAK